MTSHSIGPETCDLLDKLLTLDPRTRITATQALDHDYFWSDPLPADPKTYVYPVIYHCKLLNSRQFTDV